MRAIVLLIIVCIAFFDLHAQYKTMFPVDSITWVQSGFSLDELYYSGDTVVIDNKIYQSIKGSMELLIREDTVNGKTWIRRGELDTSEVLLMDLSLQLNDTTVSLFCYNGWNYSEYDSLVIKKIDTLKNRKIIELPCYNDMGFDNLPLRYIEGLGPSYGFPSSGFTAYGKNQILCKVFYDDYLVYAIDTFSLNCSIWPWGNVNNFNIKEYLNLFPNPTSSFVQIQLENPSLLNSQLNLFNINGQLLLSTELTNLQMKIDVRELENQMLFFEVKNNTHHFSGKILKQ